MFGESFFHPKQAQRVHEAQVHAEEVYERFIKPVLPGDAQPELSEAMALELARDGNEDYMELIRNEIENERYTPSPEVQHLLDVYIAQQTRH